EAPAGDRHAGADRPRARRAAPGDLGIVVVVDVVVDEGPARVRLGDRARLVGWAEAVLGRGRVVVVLAVVFEAVLVVVELRVLDDQLAARVRPRVSEGAVLGPVVVHHLVAD